MSEHKCIVCICIYRLTLLGFMVQCLGLVEYLSFKALKPYLSNSNVSTTVPESPFRQEEYAFELKPVQLQPKIHPPKASVCAFEAGTQKLFIRVWVIRLLGLWPQGGPHLSVSRVYRAP